MKISSRVGKIEDESISAVCFSNTPNVYLPHYYYIFINPEPLGAELNNMVCSKLEIKLYPLEKNGKESIKTSEVK